MGEGQVATMSCPLMIAPSNLEPPVFQRRFNSEMNTSNETIMILEKKNSISFSFIIRSLIVKIKLSKGIVPCVDGTNILETQRTRR